VRAGEWRQIGGEPEAAAAQEALELRAA